MNDVLPTRVEHERRVNRIGIGWLGTARTITPRFTLQTNHPHARIERKHREAQAAHTRPSLLDCGGPAGTRNQARLAPLLRCRPRLHIAIADKSQVSAAEDDAPALDGGSARRRGRSQGARGGAHVPAAAGIEATPARERSGRKQGAAPARGQPVPYLTIDLQHQWGGDPETLGVVGATLPDCAQAFRPACEHETLRTGVLVGARGFEPPTSSSRTMRATKLRHAPTAVLVEQSPGIVARPGGSRHGGAVCAAPGARRRGERRGARRSRPCAWAHRYVDGHSPEVPPRQGYPVQTSHFAPRAPPVRSVDAPEPATLERRERVVILRNHLGRLRPGRTSVKQEVKARFFGLAMTVAALAVFVVPHVMKRW